MKLRNVVVAGVLAMAGLAGSLAIGGVVNATATCPDDGGPHAGETVGTIEECGYKCGSGSLRAGDYVASIAECNIAENTNTPSDLWDTINTIINVVLGVMGILAVVMIIIGGISMVTSQGDTAKVTKGRNTILYGVVGMIVALLAFAIVNFVLKGIFG